MTPLYLNRYLTSIKLSNVAGTMSFFEYLWDDRANSLLVWVEDPDAVDVVMVEWLNGGEYTTIGVGVPEKPENGGFDIFAVNLPDTAGVEPVILTVSGVKDTPDEPRQSHNKLTERITLDAHAKFAKADRKHWLVVGSDDGPSIELYEADEKVPAQTISEIMASVRYGQTIGPAGSATGEGQGGTLRVKVLHPEDADEGTIEVEVFAADDTPLPETQINFYTLSAVDHVLPALACGQIDLNSLCNSETAVLGSHGSGKRSQTFTVPGDGENSQHLSYLDRIAIVTSPPANLVFERSATQAEKAGRSGVLTLANGKDDYPYLEDGSILDILLEAQPPRTTAGNVDIIHAYGDVGKPMQLSDLDYACEITAAVYSEVSSQISTRHGANASQLTPIDINQFLSAPSYFGLLAGLESSRLTMNAPRRLNASLSSGDEKETFKVLAAIVLSSDIKSQPRVQIWLDNIAEHSAYRAATIPFYAPPLSVVMAGIDPMDVDLGQVGRLAEELDLGKRRQTLDALTNASVLPLSFDQQFVSPLSDDIENNVSHLQDIVSEAVVLCQRAYDLSGLARNHKFEPRDLLQLASVKAPQTASSQNLLKNRAYHWLDSKLNTHLGAIELSANNLPVSELLGRIAAKLYSDFKEDFEKIQTIVRANQLVDPIQLEADNIVEFDAGKNHGMADGAQPFHRPPSHDIMTWLSGTQDDPELIVEWKSNLLSQLRKSDATKNVAH